jgi:hypothetical protein
VTAPDGQGAEPTLLRQLDTPAARALADLAALFDELQTVLRCCERLVAHLANPTAEDDDVAVEALWTTAVLSYTRCFADRKGRTNLTEDDVTATGLQGEVLEWHRVLSSVRTHVADTDENPREQYSVGVALDSRGLADGIALTATRRPTLDDQTVRQTGALAYALSQRVDERIEEHQQRVRDAAGQMSAQDLGRLPAIELVTPEPAGPHPPSER